MVEQKEISLLIETLTKFIQNETKKNSRLDDQAQKQYKILTENLQKDPNVIIPVYELRYLLELRDQDIKVIDLVKGRTSAFVAFDKITFYKNEKLDNNVSMVMDLVHNFYITEEDAVIIYNTAFQRNGIDMECYHDKS